MQEWATSLDLGLETSSQISTVYLVTFSRLLASTLAAAPHLRDPGQLTRELLREYVWKAFEEPAVTGRGGRPRGARAEPLVLKLLVVRELHSDDSVHFHVAVKLSQEMRFLPAKRTLRTRNGLASHWSSSHHQWFSVVRYCTHATTRKPVVDTEKLCWSAPGVVFVTFEDAQDEFNAAAWTKRREQSSTVCVETREEP